MECKSQKNSEFGKSKSWLYAAGTITTLLVAATVSTAVKAELVLTAPSVAQAVSLVNNSASNADLSNSALTSSASSLSSLAMPSLSSSKLASTVNSSAVSFAITNSGSNSGIVASSSVSARNASNLASLASSTALVNPIDAVALSKQSSIHPDVPDTRALHSTTAEEVYYLNLKYNNNQPVTVGETFYANPNSTSQAGEHTYQVIYSIDSKDPTSGYPDNGFEAMALSPVVNGVLDTSRVIIVYQAMNDSDKNDILTGLDTVVGGVNKLYTSQGIYPSQVTSAVNFATTLQTKYQNSSFLLTGISLGGYLAQAVGAKLHQPAIVYVSQSPANIMTSNEIAYVQAHPDLYFSYRNIWDIVVGDFGGNALRDVHYIDTGFDFFTLGHWPLAISFNADGSISSPSSPIIGGAIDSIYATINPLFGRVSSVVDMLPGLVDTIQSVISAVDTAIKFL